MAKIVAACLSQEKGSKNSPLAQVFLREIMALLAMLMLVVVAKLAF